jgi:twitching motility protein PilI
VGNLRGQLHAVIDLSAFIGLPRRAASQLDATSKGAAGRLVAFNASLQLNSALLIDRLLGLRRPADLVPAEPDEGAVAGRPHFVTAELVDDKGRHWYELNLAALAADEAFLRVAA